MAETSKANHLLQLQLRAGELAVIERLLRRLDEFDWFRDEYGCYWDWRYDVDANLYRWYLCTEEDIRLVRFGRREWRELEGAPRRLTSYAWNGGLYRREVGGIYYPCPREGS